MDFSQYLTWMHIGAIYVLANKSDFEEKKLGGKITLRCKFDLQLYNYFRVLFRSMIDLVFNTCGLSECLYTEACLCLELLSFCNAQL